MKILLADAFPGAARAELALRGHECRYEPGLDRGALPTALADSEVLVVRSTRVDAEALASGDALRLVVRAGAGTNTIDTAAAARHGIYVCNVPGRNAVAVAELAFGLLLAIDRRIPDNVWDLRQGTWNKKEYSQARGILGRSVGVIGLGATGLAFAERAAAFGARVHALAKSGRSQETQERARAAGVVFVDGLQALASACDVLSIHVPGDDPTRGLVGRELLSWLPAGAIVLNTSRGDVVDAEALIEAMDAKGIRAGLDVYPGEPPGGTGTFDSALARHPNVYGTHHIGASTEQAQHSVASEVLRIVEEFEGGTVLHCVSRPADTAGLGSAP